MYNSRMNHSFSLPTFIDDLASGEPTPGGGSAAALAGALGAALASMVGRLTAGRPRYAEVDATMRALISEADALRSTLTSLVHQDAAAYEQVRAAYRLPKTDEGTIATRKIAIQGAMQGASQTPLHTMQAALAVMQLCEQAVTLGNPNAATDGAVGALLAHAALQGAALNVQVNLGGIEAEAFVAEYRQAVAALQAEATAVLARVLAAANARLV